MKIWLLLVISITFFNASYELIGGYNEISEIAFLAKDRQEQDFGVVINEIHYDPDVKTELVEFVELHNTTGAEMNLSGWYFNDGISYQFPMGAVLPANGYIVVTMDPVCVQAKWDLPLNLVFGPFEGKLSNEGEQVELCNADGEVIDSVDYQLGFPWPIVGDLAPQHRSLAGSSIQLINPFIDNDLAGSWRSAHPTPAAENEWVYLDNTPPHTHKVKHSPEQPKSGEVVTITAKVTDSDGVNRVILDYQIVEPGSYIRITDPEYDTDWNTLEMHDDGLDGDEQSGDDIFTVELPGNFQVHRRLIRYRIEVIDSIGNDVNVPYTDDPQPNFAYFVYDGVPAWRGAIRPGDDGPLGEVVEYGPEVMNSLPVYHLISRKSDVEDCTWFDKYGGSDYKWYGTLVYDGEVYDHIRYRARGGVHRYKMGKHMWKFDFNRGHFFQAHDDYGVEYKTKWDKLNFSACIQQGDYGHRGEQGMFEAVTLKLFNIMGVPASKTNWLQFRIIDELYEDGILNAAHLPLTSSGTQYDGDFWGLYMTLEQMDGRFLDEHGLPDGNMYKMEGYSGQLANQSPTGVTDSSDLAAFQQGYLSRPAPTEDWWRANVNLDCYFSYRCVVEGTHHGDIGYGKNYYFLFNPETNLWSQLPWDVDLTWTESMYGNGEDPFKGQGEIFSNSNVEIEYQNRMREFLDLLYNTDQCYQLIDELADIIDDPTSDLSIADADRAMWDYHWVMSHDASPLYTTSSGKAGQGRFYQMAATRDFRGMVQIMKDYVVYATNNRRYWMGMTGPSMSEIAYDSQIPDTPNITYLGAADYPPDDLTFETSSFSDPQGSHTFAAMKWRIAEVEPWSQIPVQEEEQDVVLMPDGAEWKYFKGMQEPSAPITTAWREFDFDDSFWQDGATPIGWGESDTFLATMLTEMQYEHTSFYIRKKFIVEDLSTIESLELQAQYDDGFNVWINDKFVLQENMPSENVPYDGFASEGNSSEKSWFGFTLSEPNYLVEGENVIAVQVHNMSRTGSSDCFVNIRLLGKPTDPCSFIRDVLDREGRYEINAVWESEELTEFNNSIRVPSGVVEAGGTYRVRCRMKDDTGRWSHWSGPVQLLAGESTTGNVLSDLRITELMYNPSDANMDNGEPAVDNDSFEFIELQNIGANTIDLSLVSFTDGIDFTFEDFELSAGEYVVIVQDCDAFESRYGSVVNIAGEYAGRLNNGGERIRLEDAIGRIILDFSYEDDWYDITDGDGFSLTIVDTTNPDPNSWGVKDSWRASEYPGGSPGTDDGDIVP
jgi:hypothetical protein